MSLFDDFISDQIESLSPWSLLWRPIWLGFYSTIGIYRRSKGEVKEEKNSDKPTVMKMDKEEIRKTLEQFRRQMNARDFEWLSKKNRDDCGEGRMTTMTMSREFCRLC